MQRETAGLLTREGMQGWAAALRKPVGSEGGGFSVYWVDQVQIKEGVPGRAWYARIFRILLRSGSG